MTGLFSKPKAAPAAAVPVPEVKVPELPKQVRQPTYSDSAIRESGLAARREARKRKGYLSTILSDSLSNSSGTLG